MKIAITGHRPSKLGNDYSLKSPLILNIKQRIKEILEHEKPEAIISGMALGIDTLFALLGIQMQIPVLAYIPFVGQEKIWPKVSKDLYYQILAHPLVTQKIICDGGYAPWKLLERNKIMVNDSEKLIAVYDGTKGGTGHCYEYALSLDREVIRINPNDYKPCNIKQ